MPRRWRGAPEFDFHTVSHPLFLGPRREALDHNIWPKNSRVNVQPRRPPDRRHGRRVDDVDRARVAVVPHARPRVPELVTHAARHEARGGADAALDDVLDRLAALFSRGVHRHGVGAVERELTVRGEGRVQRREAITTSERAKEVLLVDPLRRRRVEAAVVRGVRDGPEAILRERAVLFQ